MVFSKILAQLIGTELEEAVSMLPVHKNNIVLQLVLAANAVVHEVERKFLPKTMKPHFLFLDEYIIISNDSVYLIKKFS